MDYFMVITFLNTAKRVLPKDTYDSFLLVVRKYRNKWLTVGGLYIEAGVVLKDHAVVMRAFETLIPNDLFRDALLSRGWVWEEAIRPCGRKDNYYYHKKKRYRSLKSIREEMLSAFITNN
jgi:hypothetical protein